MRSAQNIVRLVDQNPDLLLTGSDALLRVFPLLRPSKINKFNPVFSLMLMLTMQVITHYI